VSENVSRRLAQKLTDANCAARMKRAKLLLQKFPQSATDFVFFTDEKVFSVASPDNRQNDRGTQNTVCLHFLPYLLNICRKFEFFISQGSVATHSGEMGIVVWVLYRISYAFQQCNIVENQLRFDKVTDS